MKRKEKITIPLTLTREDWVEVVHALGSKWEMVARMDPEGEDAWLRKWVRDMRRIYNHVQKRVEAEGIEC